MRIFKIGVYCLSLLAVSKMLADGGCPEVDRAEFCPKFAGHCHSFPVGGEVALAFDYFRSLPDGSWSGNTGAFSSLNLGIGIPKEKYGFGAQIGGSYGLYDWDARGSNTTGNTKALQQQGFVTGGLFRMTPACSGFNAGAVYDVMFNTQFGVFALKPIIAQVRGQIGYLIKGGNELGFMGTYPTQTAHKQADFVPVTFRAVAQVNLFWSHYFKNTAQTTLWGGTPYRKGLMYTSGRAGRYILGASFRAPLMNALSVFGHGVYMASHPASADMESSNYAANVCFGVSYAFGGCKAGQRPYLPLADNSNFIVDTNTNL